MSIKERLLEFVRYTNQGQGAFETKVGFANGLINNLQDSITSKSLLKIKGKYPKINLNWLLTGEGEMLIDPQEMSGKEPGMKELVDAINALNKTLKAGFNLDGGAKTLVKGPPSQGQITAHENQNSKQDIERAYSDRKKKKKGTDSKEGS